MEPLRIYRIRDGYIRYLYSIDNRVQYNKGSRRPYVGIVLEVEGHQYFVPMESPKPNHDKLKANIHIMKIDGGKYGQLGFNNMIPAKDEHLIRFDINEEPNEAYRELLLNQLMYCRAHKSEIYEHARKTYKAVEDGKSFFTRICCDFKKLEREYTKYHYKTYTR